MMLSELPVEEHAVALHEAAHAVVAEILGLRVAAVEVHDGGKQGVCFLQSSSKPGWVRLSATAAGHAIERHTFGRVIENPSASDREDMAEGLEDQGLPEWCAVWAVRSLEEQMWALFTNEDIETAVENVAQELVERRTLTRKEFLEAARPALRSASLARMVRRFCRRLVEYVITDLEDEQ